MYNDWLSSVPFFFFFWSDPTVTVVECRVVSLLACKLWQLMKSVHLHETVQIIRGELRSIQWT